MSEFTAAVQLEAKEVLVRYEIRGGKAQLLEIDGHKSYLKVYTPSAIRHTQSQVNFHHEQLSQCLR